MPRFFRKRSESKHPLTPSPDDKVVNSKRSPHSSPPTPPVFTYNDVQSVPNKPALLLTPPSLSRNVTLDDDTFAGFDGVHIEAGQSDPEKSPPLSQPNYLITPPREQSCWNHHSDDCSSGCHSPMGLDTGKQAVGAAITSSAAVGEAPAARSHFVDNGYLWDHRDAWDDPSTCTNMADGDEKEQNIANAIIADPVSDITGEDKVVKDQVGLAQGVGHVVEPSSAVSEEDKIQLEDPLVDKDPSSESQEPKMESTELRSVQSSGPGTPESTYDDYSYQSQHAELVQEDDYSDAESNGGDEKLISDVSSDIQATVQLMSQTTLEDSPQPVLADDQESVRSTPQTQEPEATVESDGIELVHPKPQRVHVQASDSDNALTPNAATPVVDLLETAVAADSDPAIDSMGPSGGVVAPLDGEPKSHSRRGSGGLMRPRSGGSFGSFSSSFGMGRPRSRSSGFGDMFPPHPGNVLPPEDENAVFYPAPIPVKLQLPPLLSKKNRGVAQEPVEQESNPMGFARRHSQHQSFNPNRASTILPPPRWSVALNEDLPDDTMSVDSTQAPSSRSLARSFSRTSIAPSFPFNEGVAYEEAGTHPEIRPVSPALSIDSGRATVRSEDLEEEREFESGGGRSASPSVASTVKSKKKGGLLKRLTVFGKSGIEDENEDDDLETWMKIDAAKEFDDANIEAAGSGTRNLDYLAFTAYDPEKVENGGELYSGMVPQGMDNVTIKPSSLIEELELRKRGRRARADMIRSEIRNHGNGIQKMTDHPLDRRQIKSLLELDYNAHKEYLSQVAMADYMRTAGVRTTIYDISKDSGDPASLSIYRQSSPSSSVQDTGDPNETLAERRQRLKREKQLAKQLENETLSQRRERLKREKREKREQAQLQTQMALEGATG
uniref:ARAD1D44814p n=1 Tax=Blastobotrys adeninivorans TaxID=409370 RepID=A0A060TDL1_BLAAD